MMKRLSILMLACLLVSAAALTAQAVPTDINTLLSQWNLVTSGNLESIGDVQGSSFIGGNITDTNSFTLSMGNGSYAPSSATVTNAVVGSVVGGGPINVQYGSVDIGGVSNARIFNMNSHGTVTTGSSWPASNSPLSQFAAVSTYFSTLSGNSAASFSGNNLNFNCASGQSLAVFDVTDAATFESPSLGGVINLNPSAATTTVLINVNSLDAAVKWNTGAFNIPASWQGKVLFNFYNATSLNLHDHFDGYLLAPNADVTDPNNINGGLFCKDVVNIGEVHLPCWTGNLPNGSPGPCPEPGALLVWSLLGSTAVGLGWWRKRKAA